mgnify:CR=1 FL=1
MFIPTQMQPGTEHSAMRSGTLVIVEYIDSKNVRVKFLDTGYEIVTTASKIRHGDVRDHRSIIVQPAPDMKVGTIHSTNRHGELVITDYLASNHVCVRFLDTGYERVVTSYSIRKGSVRDSSMVVRRPQKKKAISFI